MCAATRPTPSAVSLVVTRAGRSSRPTASATWSLARGLPSISDRGGASGRVELAYARANPQVVYASLDRDKGELYRSDDGGQTYTLKNSGGEYLSGQGVYDNAVWAGDPTDANLVVVGGVELWRSTDGGKTLTQISDYRQFLAGTSAHSDQHVIVAHPGYNGKTNRTVYFGSDGGIFRADDVREVSPRAGSAEQQLRRHPVLRRRRQPADGHDHRRRQDNGTLRYTRDGGPDGWTWLAEGDGGSAPPTRPTRRSSTASTSTCKSTAAWTAGRRASGFGRASRRRATPRSSSAYSCSTPTTPGRCWSAAAACGAPPTPGTTSRPGRRSSRRWTATAPTGRPTSAPSRWRRAARTSFGSATPTAPLQDHQRHRRPARVGQGR